MRHPPIGCALAMATLPSTIWSNRIRSSMRVASAASMKNCGDAGAWMRAAPAAKKMRADALIASTSERLTGSENLYRTTGCPPRSTITRLSGSGGSIASTRIICSRSIVAIRRLWSAPNPVRLLAVVNGKYMHVSSRNRSDSAK
jgi:hypothetical protein